MTSQNRELRSSKPDTKGANIPVKHSIIGVIGGNKCSQEEYDVAFQVGRYIADAGYILVCGGKGGVMEAACRGAVEAGGITIGILPEDDAGQANEYVTIPVCSGIGLARNVMIVNTAAALIAIDGRYGTLSEIAFALQFNKPVFAIKPWLEVPGLQPVDTAKEAVDAAIASIDRKMQGNQDGK